MIDRLSAAAGNRSYRHLSDLTGIHPETVRRYMQGHAPSADFLATMCRGLGINGDWLLTGRGPMKNADLRSQALQEADASELLNAMANTIETLIDRVERLELFIQTMESRLRAGNGASHGFVEGKGVGAAAATPADASSRTPAHPPATERARRIADALTQRPRPPAG